jgi:hypothetical protein
MHYGMDDSPAETRARHPEAERDMLLVRVKELEHHIQDLKIQIRHMVRVFNDHKHGLDVRGGSKTLGTDHRTSYRAPLFED